MFLFLTAIENAGGSKEVLSQIISFCHLQWTYASTTNISEGSPQSLGRQREKGSTLEDSLPAVDKPSFEWSACISWLIHKANDGFFGSYNIHFPHKIKDCGSLDDAYVMDQLDLASLTQNHLLENCFKNFYILLPPLWNEKE